MHQQYGTSGKNEMRISPAKCALAVVAALVVAALGVNPARAQTVEDHSLPKSAVKTYHVKCGNGRLGMVRYDTRKSPVNMCVSVQDGSRPQSCVNVTLQQAPQQVKRLAQWVCQ